MYQDALHSLGSIGERTTIDYAPFERAARLLYEGPWVAERVAAIAAFYERSPGSLLPVTRSIFETSRRWDAVSTFRAFYELQDLRRSAAEQLSRMDVMVLPTTGTIYTVAEVEADPIRLNTTLGQYANFVNLLDLCAIAVPAGFRHDGLPIGVTLIGAAGTDRRLCDLASEYLRRRGITAGGPRT